MSQPQNPLTTQNNNYINHHIQQQQPQNILPSSLPIYKCHKCSSLLHIHPSQIESIKKQQQKNAKNNTNNNDNNKSIIITNNDNQNNQNKQNMNIQMSMQCVYVNCSIRCKNLFECLNCSQLSLCRNCNMPLCKLCCRELKVLECNYCDAYICSQQCYTSLLKKYFTFLENNVGLNVNAHESMHFFRKLLLPPHLHSAIGNVKDQDLPFHVCESCKVQNCGCIDWISCVNCRKYYCVDCEDKVLSKCKLEDCQSRTCCRKKQWDISCDYCNRLGDCRLIFCTKGHCSRHIIINREIGYNEINHNNDDSEQKQQDPSPKSNNNGNNDVNDKNNKDNDVNLTAQ